MTRQALCTCIVLLALAAALGLAPEAHALNPKHNCTFCHSLHGAPGQSLLNNTVVEVLCLSCHGPSGPAEIAEVAVHTNKTGSAYSPFTMTCVDCHDPHSDEVNWTDPGDGSKTNLKLVLATIDTPNSSLMDVVFESRGTGVAEPSLYSFADNDEDGLTSTIQGNALDGVCEVCHTQTTHFRNDGLGPDQIHGDPPGNVGKTCTSCHPHVDNFAPSSPTSNCNTCHNGSVPTRDVISEFALSSHHVLGAYDDANCLACHPAGSLHTGNVIVANVDDGTEYTLLADPATDSVEAAKLTDFCLSCHDGDAGGTTTPFTDGVDITPFVVDPTDWTAGSHEAIGTLSCYGDGSTFGCHGTAHGSEKLNLLAPYDVAPTGPAYAEEQEGFCFNCHSSTGLASTDIEALFDASHITRHPVKYADQSFGGRNAECTTCHGQHYVSDAPARSNDNLATGRIDTVWGVDSSGTTAVDPILYEYELCFKCHANYSPGGTPGTGDGGPDPVTNKAAQFATGNATFHPVIGVNNNQYASPTSTNGDIVTMVAPWNQSTDEHNTMHCTDCHFDPNVDGPHGSVDAGNNAFGLPVRPSMLRAQLSAVEMDINGALDPGSDDWVTPLCIQCHSIATYRFTGNGSNFSGHDVKQHAVPDWSGGYGGCLSCHFGGLSAADGNMTGAIHGGANDHNNNGGTILPGYLNGSRIVNNDGPGGGSCNPIDDRNNGCRGHNQSY